MSDNVVSAGNQQATTKNHWSDFVGASETTRQTPLLKLEILAYLNGALHDASLNKGKRIRFAQKEIRWLGILQSLLATIGYNSWIYKEGRLRNVYILETLCTELDFKFNPLLLKTEPEKRAYVRGFFDAEGGIPHTADRFYIQLVQKNYEKIAALKKVLKELGIESGKVHNPSKKVDPDYWRIFISAKSYKLFYELINSWHPMKVEIFRRRMKI